jgi:hypothetical protein
MKSIIEMALEAGFYMPEDKNYYEASADDIKRLVAFARDDENEACAEIAYEAEPFCSADLIRARRKE